MMKSFIAAVFGVAAQAACEADHETYPSFSEAIDQFEYDWEPFTTTTEDGYILTMFRLAGPIGNYPVHRTASQSVLIMPGLGMSADSWFPSPEYGEPMPIQLYEAGYDVWLGNNRGTTHSLRHTHHHHEHDAEQFWNWSFSEMGTKDLPAMFNQIKYTIQQNVEDPHIRHTDKIVYIGYDQGATQMLYGLSYMEESYYKDIVRGAIFLAPCTKMNILGGTQGYHYYSELVDQIDLIGLYGLHGLNWETFKPDVCAHLGRQWCDQDTVWAEEPISARALTHYFQMGIEGRFQEYAESYLQGKQHRITADIPIEHIQHVPIAVFYGDADRVCPMDSVEWMMSRVGHMVYGNYQFGGYDHADFGKANDQVFMGELHEALSHLQPHDFDEEELFEEDLSRALEAEYEHQREADFDHEHDIEEAHEFGHHEGHEGHHSDHHDTAYYGSEEVDEQPSWRDDHYHDHSGFNLQRHEDQEEQYRGMGHEDGVEHIDNERMHQRILAAKGAQFLESQLHDTESRSHHDSPHYLQ